MNDRYVALLRGVNVGGKSRITQVEFRTVLESLGFRDVTIYINSGNAVFTSPEKPNAGDIQNALEAHFGFDIATLVLPAQKVRAIAAAIPPHWTNDPATPDKTGNKSDVTYLFDDINNPGIIGQIGYKPELETIHYIDGALLTTISRANQSQGSLQKLISTKLYQKMTIRNITTAKKLAELV